MNVEELKRKIVELLGNVTFNHEFNKNATKLQSQADNLLDWCELVAKKEIQAKPSKKYKNIILFIRKLGSTNRCIVIKVKNGKFVEFHLGDHEYYDKLKKMIGL